MNPEIIGNRVKEIMKNKNITVQELSEKIGINKKCLEKKLEGKEEFYLDEMIKIKKILNLNLEESDYLFFKKEMEV